jgi:hypothetical protein
MSRNIAILGLIQMLLVILGFFGLGIVMKIAGYPSEDFGIHWNPLALFLRQHGLFLLVVPLFWTIFAATSQNQAKFIFSLDVWSVLGLVMTITIISIFLYACVFPYTRPILIGR